jgi:hypothetical protein
MEVLELKGRQPCVATCSLFRCDKRALYIKYNNPQNRGGYGQQGNPWEPKTIADGAAYCNWVGDVCVISKCSFAFCSKRALLPDGSCGYESRESARQAKSIEEEAQLEGPKIDAMKSKILKKVGKEFVE